MPVAASPPPRRSERLLRLRAACSDGTTTGPRDEAIIALLSLGLAAGEVVFLLLSDAERRKLRPRFGRWYRRRRLRLVLGGRLVVRGAGGRTRVVALPPGARLALHRWLRVRGNAPGRLVCALTRARRPIPYRGLQLGTVKEILHRRAERAGISRMGPNAIRRLGLLERYAAGDDLSVLRQAAGHTRLSWTRRFLGLARRAG